MTHMIQFSITKRTNAGLERPVWTCSVRHDEQRFVWFNVNISQTLTFAGSCQLEHQEQTELKEEPEPGLRWTMCENMNHALTNSLWQFNRNPDQLLPPGQTLWGLERSSGHVLDPYGLAGFSSGPWGAFDSVCWCRLCAVTAAEAADTWKVFSWMHSAVVSLWPQATPPATHTQAAIKGLLSSWAMSNFCFRMINVHMSEVTEGHGGKTGKRHL